MSEIHYRGIMSDLLSSGNMYFWYDTILIFVHMGVFMTVCWTTIMCTRRGIMFLWRGKLTRTQIKLFEIFHMHLSYPKTLTKMELCSVHILWFHTLNKHILLIKHDSDDDRSLGKTVFWARASAPYAKNWNFSPSITILIGFYRILIFGEKYTIHGVWKSDVTPKNSPKAHF